MFKARETIQQENYHLFSTSSFRIVNELTNPQKQVFTTNFNQLTARPGNSIHIRITATMPKKI